MGKVENGLRLLECKLERHLGEEFAKAYCEELKRRIDYNEMRERLKKALIESFKESFRKDSFDPFKRFYTEYDRRLVVLAVTPECATYSKIEYSEYPYVVEMLHPVYGRANEVKVLAYVKTEDEARKLCRTPWKPFILVGFNRFIPGQFAIEVEDIFELD
jgi:hypothetical protein